MTANVEYGPIGSYDAFILQRMVQGSRLSNLNFNNHSHCVFVARQYDEPVGFVSGTKGFGQNSHVLTIKDSFLRLRFKDPEHPDSNQTKCICEQEMMLAFINWAQQKLGVTHYKLNQQKEPRQIGIDYLIPLQSVEEPEPELDMEMDFIELPVQEFHLS